jgi:hypothetical protein
MQATTPAVIHPYVNLADRLRHVLQEDNLRRECAWLERIQRVLHAIELTFAKHQTVGDTNGVRPREMIQLEAELPEQARQLLLEVNEALDAFKLPEYLGGRSVNWPFAIGLMMVPDLDHIKERGEILGRGLVTLSEEVSEAAYAAAYTDLGGED